MSYHPSQVNISEVPSGIVYYGHSPSDQVYEADSGFTIGGGYLSATAIKVDDGSTIGSDTTPGAITIAGNGDVSLAGNLTVNGTTTTVNSTTITVEDPIIILGSGTPTSDDNKDRGISFNYYDGSAKTGFFGFDDSSGKFTFVPNATINSEVVTGSVGTIAANIEGDLVGDIYASNGTSKILENGTNGTDATFTGLASQATKLATSRDFSLTGQVTASAVGFDGTGNVALSAALDVSAITGQTAETSIASDDFVLIYDTSATALRKMTRANFVSGLTAGSMSSFVLEDADGTEVTIDDGKEVKFIGSAGVTIDWTDVTDGSDADPYDLTFSVDHDQITNFVANEHIDHTSVTLTAGNGLSGGGDISASRTFDVNVDDITVEINSDNVRVKDAGITEVKRSRTVDANVTSSKTANNDVTLVNAGSGSVTISLPENGTSGRVMIVKRTDSSSNDVIISRSGSDTIDGSTQFQLYYQWETLTFISDGSNWYII
jgi:hypothetical protein